jgi:hypothetical protein
MFFYYNHYTTYLKKGESMGTREHGNMGTREHGNMGTGEHGNIRVWEVSHRVALKATWWLE